MPSGKMDCVKGAEEKKVSQMIIYDKKLLTLCFLCVLFCYQARTQGGGGVRTNPLFWPGFVELNAGMSLYICAAPCII